MNVTPDTIKKNKGGRPSRWSIATAKKICSYVRRGIPLRYSGPLAGVPWSTCKEWVGDHPEFGPMLEEAHSEFVQNHVGNIERLSGNSEKASQWLLERRAKEEFSAPYTQSNTQQGSINVLALGNDALGKLMQGWSGMLGGEMKQAEVVEVSPAIEQNTNKEPSPSLLVHNSTESSEVIPLKEIAEEKKIEEAKIEEVKPKRGRGRPRKYPKPDPAPTPPTPPTPQI